MNHAVEQNLPLPTPDGPAKTTGEYSEVMFPMEEPKRRDCDRKNREEEPAEITLARPRMRWSPICIHFCTLSTTVGIRWRKG